MAICFLAFWVFVGVTSAATIYVPDDYAKIQWAVDNATTGDITIVESGTYHENVIVDKQLILRGVDTGFGRPVIDANYLGSPVTLSADEITLEGFEVRHSGDVLGSFDCGIKVWFSNGNVVRNNTIRNNFDGILNWNSNNSTITSSTVINNHHFGITSCVGSSNNITGNTVSNNDYEGVYPYKSSGNKIYLNNFINNADNVRSYESTNIWNSTEITKYKYKEEEYKNYLGNYWSDHDCVDRNGDGICDDAYGIDGDWDYRPLVEPFNAPPSVEIATDKDEYEAGDVMRISITLRNPPTGITLEDSPTEERDVVFRWWLEFPDYGLSFSVVETMLTLPVGYERVFTLRWTLPDFGVSFHATWHVALYDAETLGLLSEDTADWWFVGRGARVHQHSFQK